MNIENSLWVEKYRPKKLEDVVLSEDYKLDFEKWISKGEIPNILFIGQVGSGKTTLARILTSKTGVMKNSYDNLLTINGSAKETRSISYVQDVIEPFLKIPPIGNDKHKIVFIDEADYLTDAAFNSLRGVIEKYSSNSRFILTGNYISKIPDPIQSRCQTYVFKQFPIQFVYDYCKKILESEKIEYQKADVDFVIDGLYPDIRKIVGVLQKSSATGKLKVNRDIINTNEKLLTSSVLEIVSFISKGEMSKIGKVMNTVVNLLNGQDLDFRNIYSTLFYHSEIPGNVKIIINKYSNSHQDCLIPSMHFCSLMFDIIQGLKEYYTLVGKKNGG